MSVATACFEKTTWVEGSPFNQSKHGYKLANNPAVESKQNYDYTTCSLLFTKSSCLHILSSPISSISFLLFLHVLAEEQIPEKLCNFGYNNYHTYQLQNAPLFDAYGNNLFSFI